MEIVELNQFEKITGGDMTEGSAEVTSPPERGAVRPYKCSHCQDGQIVPKMMPTIVVEETEADEAVCIEMVPMGANLDVPSHRPRRKKSKVQNSQRTKVFYR